MVIRLIFRCSPVCSVVSSVCHSLLEETKFLEFSFVNVMDVARQMKDVIVPKTGWQMVARDHG